MIRKKWERPKEIPVSSIDKTKKINRDSKEPEVQNDILNDQLSKSILYMWISPTVNNRL